MTQERLSNVVLTAALVVVAAAWLWFLFAYAGLVFRHRTNIKAKQPTIPVGIFVSYD